MATTYAAPAGTARAAGGLLGGFFDGLARLRGGKPVHTRGQVLTAQVRRHGAARRWGTAWLDEPGTETGVARFSRAVGLPHPLPDVLGLAVGFTGPDGRRCDLLLSTTGLVPGARHVMLPRRAYDTAVYTTLLPYATGQGRSVLLAAVPRPGAGDGSPDGPVRFALAAASATSGWDRFGELVLSRPVEGPAADAPVSFDPVLHPLPGLRLPEPLARLRAGAYRGARHGRDVRDGELAVTTPPAAG